MLSTVFPLSSYIHSDERFIGTPPKEDVGIVGIKSQDLLLQKRSRLCVPFENATVSLGR